MTDPLANRPDINADACPDAASDAQDQFSRIRRLLGDEAVERLGRGLVVVVGLGAVGGYAAEALCRSGVGRLRLVDFDIVKPSDLNRQILALHSTLGRSKTAVAAERAADIHPDCRVETLDCFAHTDSFDAVLAGEPDVVVDAIDAMGPKAALIAECHRRGLPMVSAMGAAMRRDPAALRIDRLSRTRICPLARQIRRKLRRLDSPADPLCVYSIEPIDAQAADAVEDDADATPDYYSRGRTRRTLGSLPTMTGIFGLAAAQTALNFFN